MTITKYFPGCYTTFFFVSLSLYTASPLARLGINAPNPHPRHLRGGCKSTLDNIFLWFPSQGLYTASSQPPQYLSQILLPLFPNT